MASSGRAKDTLLEVVDPWSVIVSEALLGVVREEFGWIDVARVTSLDETASEGPPHRVALVGTDVDLASLAAFSSGRPGVSIVLTGPVRSGAVLDAGILSLPGFMGVIPRDVPLDVWIAALRVVLLGGSYLPKEMLEPRVEISVQPSRPVAVPDRSGALGCLTGRELEVLRLVSTGLQNKLIAVELDLSENTVKIHLHHIISKLKLHNRTEAAGLYLGRHLAEREPEADGLRR